MRGVIYKLYTKNSPIYYIGSTKRTLEQRLSDHLYTPTSSSRKVITCGDVCIDELEVFDEIERTELYRREKEVIMEHKNNNPELCVNAYYGQTLAPNYHSNYLSVYRKKYAVECHDKKIKSQAKWRAKNADKIREYQRSYNERKKKLNADKKTIL